MSAEARILDREAARSLLGDRLAERGWSGKEDLYYPLLTGVRLRPRPEPPAISIVIISWRGHPDTRKNLEILAAQREIGFELVFVDNGAPPGEFDFALPHCEVYLRLSENTGAFLARNLGAVFASSPILLFLDDDGLPAEDLVASHLEAFRSYDCWSVRGICLPKTDNPLNQLARHYDLGNRPFPQYPVIEGNTSFDARIFYRVGGWDDQIRFGGGGTDLARRVAEIEPDMRRQVYHPGPVIRHDYVRDQAHLEAKRATQISSFERLFAKHPDYRIWRYVWEKFLGREEELLLRVGEPKRARALPSEGEPPRPPGPEDELGAALARIGWTGRRDSLTPAFAGLRTARPAAAPGISVVVSAAAGTTTSRCLRGLAAQRGPGVEILVVQAAPVPGEFADLADTFVGAHPGTPTNVLRNLGAAFARAPVLLFLEDREEPAADLVAAHLDLHACYDVVAVQGAILPRTESPWNREAGFFLPADRPFPLFADANSNTSYRAEVFYRAGGWDAGLGSEGAGFALSRAIAAIEPDLRRQIFSPTPRIERDEAEDAVALDERRRRFAATQESLRSRIPDFSRFLACWDFFEQREDLLPRRGHEDFEACAREALEAFCAEPDYFASVVRLLRLLEIFPEQLYTTYRLGFWRYLTAPSPEELLARRESWPANGHREPFSPAREDFAAAVSMINARLRRFPWFETPKPRERQLPLSIFCLKTYAFPEE